MDSGDTERGSRGGAALQQPKYGAHGVWPTVLYTFVVMLLLWCLKMSYCILAGHLDGTPVSKHVVLWTHLVTVSAILQVLQYPGLALYCNLRNTDYIVSPKWHFFGSFANCLVNSMNVLSTLMLLAKLPNSMDPSQPGYTVPAARVYTSWMNVDMPVYAMLSALVAMLIVIDYTAWMWYDQWKKLETQREIELRERTRRWRLMFDRPEQGRPEHAEMATGVVERAHSREENKAAGATA